MSSHVYLVPHWPAGRTAATLGGTLLAVMLLVFPSSLLAQVSGLRGVVVDPGGEPVAGAGLALDGRPLSVQTAEDGSFSLPSVHPGEHTCGSIGSASNVRSVTVRTPTDVPLRIVLDPRPIPMQGLTAIGSPAELAEVRERMREVPGGVDLIEERDLERTRQVNFFDVLRFTPGVYAQSRFGAADETSCRYAAPDCGTTSIYGA